MSIEQFTRDRCPELADFLEDCCVSPLAFHGAHPIEHSADNHIHLWALEYWADHHKWIDLEYRSEFAEHILDIWRGRLKGLTPYRASGYRMYLYQDLAPTLSVVAETPYGFPYGGTAQFVNGSREIMKLYADRSWRANFQFDPWQIDDRALLAAVEKHAGSISKPTADALHVSVGELRRLIEQMNVGERVNAIRKRYKRRPAAFKDDETFEHTYKIYEQRLPPGYR